MATLLRYLLSLSMLAFLTAADEEQCSRPADIVFLLDDSRSIWYLRFYDELNFVKNMISNFDIGIDTTRIAAATFSSGVKLEFSLGEHNNLSEVQQAVDNIKQRNGDSTDTSTGIRFARETMFKDARPDVPHILVIITDGVSHKREETKQEAEETIRSGITIIVIGVGRIDKARLAEMASTPTEEYLFTVSSFPDLSNINSLVAIQACQAQGDQPYQETECHSKPAEVVFVLDKSNSVYMLDFQKQLAFVSDIIETFDIGPDRTRVAAISFSTNATPEFHLDEFHDKQTIQDRTKKIAYTGGFTDTKQALEMVRNEILTEDHGVRKDAAHIVIVITDGRSQDTMETKAVADSLKDNGVHMFAIGVGREVDPKELRDIGSSPPEQYVFEVDSYGALATLKDMIISRTCSQLP